ncbi:MAG: DUF2846 domain-containing protein [Pasteurellaceae bacterium]|nr:DUF2846 domain-containing protein [Pasteurellaceae bacterium]
MKRLLLFLPLLMAGCATVPMASPEEDQKAKQFTAPSKGFSGLYVYRDAFLGGGRALKKDVYVDDKRIGETAHGVYFYKLLKAGKHKISTESEFSNNDLHLNMQSGKNYFVEQYIRPGVFVGGANINQVSEEKGKKAVLERKLAISY